MRHWSERYVGMPYAEADCAELAARVQREVFGRVILLPSERRPGLRGLTRQIETLKGDYATRTDSPADGDGVLMVSRGRIEHVGVYCEIGSAPYVLHAMRSAGQVVLHRARDLSHQGLTVEGYYQWL